MCVPAACAAAILSVTSAIALAQDGASVERLAEAVEADPGLSGAVWLELLNAFDDWEKVALVFGYAGPGDYASCLDMRSALAERFPARQYRCNSVK